MGSREGCSPAFPTGDDDDGEGQRARAVPRKKIQDLPSLTNTKLLCFVTTRRHVPQLARGARSWIGCL